MALNLKGRDFLKIADFSVDEINYMLNLSHKLKNDNLSGTESKQMIGKNVVLLFQKDSTRTRSSFEIGAYDQGANVTYFGPSGSHFGKKESVADTARVLSRMYDGIEFRGFGHEDVEELAKYSYVPVWNGLTDKWHPTQMLADFMTMQEQQGRKNLKGTKFTYMGDANNNMANSYIIMSAKMGVNMSIGAPKDLWPDEDVIKMAEEFNKHSGGSLHITEDPVEAVTGAHYIATDIWVSLGEDKTLWGKRIELLKKYQVNKELVSHADDDYLFLHCLPALHNLDTDVAKEVYELYGFGKDGFEVTDEIFESDHSRVFEQAENRKHTIKAIMVATIGNR